MPTKDGFSSDHPFPVFLADEPEQQGIAKAWGRAAIASRVLKASILIAAATAICIAVLSVVNPVTIFSDVTASFADVTASLVDKSALQPGTEQPVATIEAAADAQALPPTANEAPARDEMAAVSEPAGQSQTENSELATEALFKQFQAWAAEKAAQAQAEPVQSVQDAPAKDVQAPAQVAENSRASSRPTPRHRHARAAHNARAEMRSVHNPRKKVRREQNAGAQVSPPQDARAQQQDQPVQNGQAPAQAPAQVPSFLQTLGWRN